MEIAKNDGATQIVKTPTLLFPRFFKASITFIDAHIEPKRQHSAGERRNMSTLSTKTTRHRTTQRQGAATVELAVCLPLIVLIVMGSIQGASMIFMRQALVQSAYETVKASVKTYGGQAEGLERGERVLAARRMQGHQISINPANVDDLDRGTPVTVTVTAPGDANTIFPFGPFAGRQITAQATMLKE